MSKKFCSVLLALIMLMAAAPAQAYPETFSGWVQGSSIGSITYWGRTSIELSGTFAYARAYEYACYQSGSEWLTYELPAGYMWSEADIYEGYDYKGSSNTTNNGYADHVVVFESVYAHNNLYYTANGRMKAYNWNTGFYTPVTELIYSPSLKKYASTSSSPINDGLYSWDGSPSQAAVVLRVYGVTDTGETYGTALLRNIAGTLPDWICAKATNGQSGYISAKDWWTPTPLNPADAVSNFTVERVRSIPVYAEPGGGEIIGWIDLHYGGSN